MFECLKGKNVFFVVEGGKKLFGLLLNEDENFIQIRFHDGNVRFISKLKILDLKELDKKSEVSR